MGFQESGFVDETFSKYKGLESSFSTEEALRDQSRVQRRYLP